MGVKGGVGEMVKSNDTTQAQERHKQLLLTGSVCMGSVDELSILKCG